MEVIVSHVNLDFDGLACLLAAKKLHPNAKVALTDKQHPTVKSFLAIYRDQLAFSSYENIDWKKLKKLILVDVASVKRTGIPLPSISTEVETIVYDHHSPKDDDLTTGIRYIKNYGAAITLLFDHIMEQGLSISPFEATLFGLGLYTDTGNFTFQQTTARDLHVASILRELQMDVTLIDRFQEQVLTAAEKQLLHVLLTNGEEKVINGITMFVTSHEQSSYIGGLATITRKVLESTGVDAVISIVKMKDHVYVVARSSSERVDFRSLMENLGGGGHSQAASATVKKTALLDVKKTVQTSLNQLIRKAITAADIMSFPVKSVSPNDSINSVLEQMYQYGHTGFPVLNEQNELIGVISRRDVDKATHHGLGHAPVKGYMTTQLVVLSPTTSLETIQETMMKHNIGRIPIVNEEKQVVGILSRTNVIEQLHKQTNHEEEPVLQTIKKQLSPDIYKLLIDIGTLADEQQISAFLIGGVVRDFLLERPNEDIDIVVEDDGILFADLLSKKIGGDVKTHEKFGTATWTTPSGLKLDIVTCRTEYYDSPGTLPIVRPSNLREDLRRRDFTINAMALQINRTHFGTLIDFFQGQEDIKKKKIRILHTLSFIEDPTRIIRAVRFAIRFNYKLAEQTYHLAIDACSMLKQVSSTRFLHEMDLLIKENSIIPGVQLLNDIGVWKSLFDLQVKEHQMASIKRLESYHFQDPFSYLIALLYKQKAWKHQIKRYAITTKQQQLVKQLEEMAKTVLPSNITLSELHLRFATFKEENLLLFALLIQHKKLEQYIVKRQNLNPLLTGEDLIEQGIKPGPKFSEILHQLTCLQLDQKLLTKKEAIDWLLQTKF
ncbi:CBS domain-containing protein [Halalkalibacter alkalisediminis]|uniref:CBS domain-containing protein n=1 Tax=Halalkalibacter alkalisediminis TaxID=935616 RepID=A0ABV6NAA8_9BACI|nr:CBS domain-containing protein [Halalkalibacter alkalisediminis]